MQQTITSVHYKTNPNRSDLSGVNHSILPPLSDALEVVGMWWQAFWVTVSRAVREMSFMPHWRDHKRQYSLGGWSGWGGAGQQRRRWSFPQSAISKAAHTAPVRGDREASVPHIKTAGVTDRVPLLQASMVCTVHKSCHCVKGHVVD